MVKVALLVRLEAKPGRENDVRSFLESGLTLVHEEPATTTWYAMQMGPSSFGIFDAFSDDEGRKVHLAGKVAKALAEKASDLFAVPPEIIKVDIIAAKLPQSRGQIENQPSAAV
jgi:quinol monooxygenase YgiN